MMILTVAEIRKALDELYAFSDARPTDTDAIASAIERATNLQAACEEGSMDGAEADTSMYGIMGAGASGVRQRLQNRLDRLENEDA